MGGLSSVYAMARQLVARSAGERLASRRNGQLGQRSTSGRVGERGNDAPRGHGPRLPECSCGYFLAPYELASRRRNIIHATLQAMAMSAANTSAARPGETGSNTVLVVLLFRTLPRAVNGK